MNATVVPQDSDHWLTATDRIGGLAYGLGVSIGILLLISTIFIASYYCTRSSVSASPTSSIRARRRQRQTNETSPSGQFHDSQNDTVVMVEDLGLDEDVIKSFPKLPYEEARVSYNSKRESSTTSCCSICLADYNKTDMIRILPDCHHLFHDKCIDPWLRLNSTCPLCRTSPLPSPAMTPVADVVPSPRRIIDI